MASHTLMINLSSSSSSSLISSKTHLNFHTNSALSIPNSSFLFVNNNNKSIKKLLVVQAMGSSSSSSQKPEKTQEAGQSGYSSLTEEEWRKRLTPEQFYICRQKGTERPFTGEYWNSKAQGTYHCVCCDTPLFESSTKFDSGTGWPSYYEGIGNNVKSKLDLSIIFMPRQEVLCGVCDAHLGHVFGDGPPPTGKRFCINSAALELKSKNVD